MEDVRRPFQVSPASTRPASYATCCCLRDFRIGELRAHLADSFLVVVLGPGLVEDGRSRHEHVCARLRDLLDVGHAAPTVHLLQSSVGDISSIEWLGQKNRALLQIDS